MKTIEYRCIDKSGWESGPWTDEPDKVQWQDEASSLPCLAVRHPSMGFWCGYVGVDEGHPYFDKGYGSELINVDCHGGLTYSGFCVEDNKEHGICHLPDPGEPDKVWWLGFDCMHGSDYAPGLAATISKVYRQPWSKYRDLEYVKAECASLARQLKECRGEGPHTKGPVDEPAQQPE